MAFHDAKHITGAGEGGNRKRMAVGHTVPFDMLVQSFVVIWYHLAGHSPGIADEHRQRARWHKTETHRSYQDMITTLRRVIIAAQFLAGPLVEPTPEQIEDFPLAWVDAAA